MAINLPKKDLALIQTILKKHIPNAKTLLFGSRITEKTKPFSDIDLVIKTDFPLETLVLFNLREAFSESNLPYRVDLSEWTTLTDSFQERILKNHVDITPL